jgi:nucleoside-diphosphate-sugar epimerase
LSKILITGASGFIGSHVAEYFSDKGRAIKCLVKENSDIAFLRTHDIPITLGDITDEESIRKALNDCDSIIHIAGLSRDWGKKSDFYQINVDGTLNILRAAKSLNINKIIITGSVSSYGEEDCPVKKNETSVYNSHYQYFIDSIFHCKMNYYRDSKALATQKAIKYAEEENLNMIVIEPAFVFGEREFHTGFFEYLKAVKNGAKILPGSAKNKFHVIYARELARAYDLAWQNNIQGVERIIIGNSDAPFQHNFYRLLCERAGLRKPKNIPKIIIYPVGMLMELFAAIVKSKNPPVLTRGRVNMFYDNVEYDVLKAKKILGFETIMTLDESVEKTVNWYKVNGYL